jgi:hypothetical protein
LSFVKIAPHEFSSILEFLTSFLPQMLDICRSDCLLDTLDGLPWQIGLLWLLLLLLQLLFAQLELFLLQLLLLVYLLLFFVLLL